MRVFNPPHVDVLDVCMFVGSIGWLIAWPLARSRPIRAPGHTQKNIAAPLRINRRSVDSLEERQRSWLMTLSPRFTLVLTLAAAVLSGALQASSTGPPPARRTRRRHRCRSSSAPRLRAAEIAFTRPTAGSRW
jgi:hypothetical protein